MGFVLLLLFSLLGIKSGILSVLALFVLSSMGYFLYLIFFCWLFSAPKRNPLMYKNRSYEIDQEFITVYWNDGSLIKIKFENIVRCTQKKTHFFFYISSYNAFYLSLKAIPNPKDLEALLVLLKVKLL